MRLSSLKFIVSILITSLLITGCSNPIDEYQENINNACDSLSLNLEEAILDKDPVAIDSLRSDLEFRSLVLSRVGFSDYENIENNPYYLQASNSLKSIVETFVKSDGLTLSDEFISAMYKFIMIDCKKYDSTETTQIDPNTSEEEIIQSQPDLKVDEEITPDPETGVDISVLPSGKRNSNAYAIGVEQANAFITTGGLTRATYSNLGGLENSCKFILDTFMALSGGASTRQQYADFLLGCSVVLKEWY
jgi:hypothetical protein